MYRRGEKNRTKLGQFETQNEAVGCQSIDEQPSPLMYWDVERGA